MLLNLLDADAKDALPPPPPETRKPLLKPPWVAEEVVCALLVNL
jgi:hypothetical protein